MAVYRVHKTKDYTTICNYHLKDKDLSLKAKGMLTLFLSLPDDWDYSVLGITSIVKESKNTVNAIMNELEEHKYLIRKRIYEGKLVKRWEYDIYEKPKDLLHPNSLDIKNVDINSLDIKNRAQLNTKEIITKKSITKKSIYGEFKNVLLTDEELNKLKNSFGDYKERIENLSYYIESSGKKYKSHYATILNWSRKETKTKGGGTNYEYL